LIITQADIKFGLPSLVLLFNYMASVEFEDENQNSRPKKDRGKIVAFIRDKLGVSGATAKKILIGIGVIALLVSLYFSLQLLI
jgi:hypothetical protein